MEDVKIIQKPDSISWEDIHNLLLAAHKRNIEKGIVLKFAQMSGEEIEEKLGEEGRCWVALDGEKLVGTTSVSFFIGKGWWNNGKKVAHGCFTGILKSYQGTGILEELNAKKYEYIKAVGVDMNSGDTAEDNIIVRKVLAKDNYKTVAFFASDSSHYSVRLVKWLNKCPFTDRYIDRRFKISKIITKLRYKPGQIERSRFTTFLSNKIYYWVKKYYGDL